MTHAEIAAAARKPYADKIKQMAAVQAVMLEALEVALHSGELSLGNHAYAAVADAVKLARGL